MRFSNRSNNGAHKAAAASFRIRSTRLPDLMARIRHKLFQNCELRIYGFQPSCARKLPPPAITLNKDSKADLLCFVPTEKWQSRNQFVEEAMSRMERGEHCYTRVEDGMLVHYGWLIERQARSYMTEIGQWWDLPPNSAVLYDFYTHPDFRARGFHPASLLQAIHDAAAVPGVQNIHSAVMASNTASRFWFERLGATHHVSFFYRRILWYSHSRCVIVSDYQHYRVKVEELHQSSPA